MKLKTPWLIFISIIISGCATGPKFPTDKVLTGITPKMVVRHNDAYFGKKIIWGGMIVNSTNLKKTTQLEILGFPLSKSQRPRTGARPQRRFLATHDGYLETVNFAKGRYVTILGTISRNQRGKVGKSAYDYPAINAEKIYLWPPASEDGGSGPRFHFGIGVVFGR